VVARPASHEGLGATTFPTTHHQKAIKKEKLVIFSTHPALKGGLSVVKVN
jgi:hypothetical protein